MKDGARGVVSQPVKLRVASLKPSVRQRGASARFEFPPDFAHQREGEVAAIAFGTPGRIAGGGGVRKLR